MRKAVGAAVLSGITLLSRPSPAQQPAPSAPEPTAEPVREKILTTDVGAGTIFPLYVGAQGMIEFPLRLQAQLEFGWMPKPYAYTIDGFLHAVGVYPELVSQLIREALQSSLVFRPSIGWRPFPNHGFEFLVGYTLVTIGGGLSARQAIEAVTNTTLPIDVAGQIPLQSTLHNIHVQLGWRFVVADHWVIRPSVEFLHCFASTSSIDVTTSTPAGDRVIRNVNAAIDRYMDFYYTSYVYTPLVGLTTAYRF